MGGRGRCGLVHRWGSLAALRLDESCQAVFSSLEMLSLGSHLDPEASQMHHLGTVNKFVILPTPKILIHTELYFLLASFTEILPASPALFPAMLHVCHRLSQFLNYTRFLLPPGPLHMLLVLSGIPSPALLLHNRHFVS